MGRLIFWLVLGSLAWFLFSTWRRRQGDAANPAGKTAEPARQVMLPCAHCGAYSPENEGVVVHGRFFCQKPHALAAGERLDD
ncbi:MAG: PP0621 family protein [Burkholderiaceae bacterium]|jgi:hypothetical protein